MRLVEPDQRERLARPRPGVEREPFDLPERLPAEQPDTPHRPPRRDREPRHDLVTETRPAQVFDRRDQGDVERARRQPVGQSARHVHLQPDARRELGQAVIQRLGVEVAHGPDADRTGHPSSPSPGQGLTDILPVFQKALKL